MLFWDTVNGYQKTAALRAAIELGLFTAIGRGSQTADVLATKAGASPRGVRILCDYLTVIGFLEKSGSNYRLTPDSAMFLSADSPAYMGGAIDFLLGPMLKGMFDDLTAVVRKGGTLTEQGTMAPDHPIWRDFARAMVPIIMPSAQHLAEALGGEASKVLDIAAGHGMFGISVAKRNSAAQIYACDWEAVLTVAEEHARAAGVADRFHKLPGSAFDVDFGTGYDLIIVANFFHHFDIPTCEGLIKKLGAAMTPNGRIATMEFVPNEDRISPPPAATFAMMMLGSTARGDAYTVEEYRKMFANCGFTKYEARDVPFSPSRLLISSR